MWVLAYLDDLEADFQAIYGIEDMMEVESSAKFFRLAERTFAFEGVMSARYMAENQDSKQSRGQDTAPQPQTRRYQGPGKDHPIAQRVNIRKMGGETASVQSDKTPYYESLRQRG